MAYGNQVKGAVIKNKQAVPSKMDFAPDEMPQLGKMSLRDNISNQLVKMKKKSKKRSVLTGNTDNEPGGRKGGVAGTSLDKDLRQQFGIGSGAFKKEFRGSLSK